MVHRRPHRNLLPSLTGDRLRYRRRHRRHPILQIQEEGQLLKEMQRSIIVFTTRKIIQDRENILKRAGFFSSAIDTLLLCQALFLCPRSISAERDACTFSFYDQEVRSYLRDVISLNAGSFFETKEYECTV
jgi:hypothetical protein